MTPDQFETFRAFFDDCIMVPWKGMILGIEAALIR